MLCCSETFVNSWSISDKPPLKTELRTLKRRKKVIAMNSAKSQHIIFPSRNQNSVSRLDIFLGSGTYIINKSKQYETVMNSHVMNSDDL